MRPIKFRAWDKKFKKMYEGDIRIVLAFPNDDVEIMQFTGLKDKNGKEIYEGDILDGHSDGLVKVMWFEDSWVCVFDDAGASCITLAEMCIWFGNNSEVIGNIYENPELLNVPSEKGFVLDI